MFKAIGNFLSGGGMGTIERLATEFIETDMEKAEASSLFIKTLDPNGKMRRDLSRFASTFYGFYLFMTTVLIFLHSFGVTDPNQSQSAMDSMTNLFLPITTAWGGIVSASFGVNGVNSFKGRP